MKLLPGSCKLWLFDWWLSYGPSVSDWTTRGKQPWMNWHYVQMTDDRCLASGTCCLWQWVFPECHTMLWHRNTRSRSKLCLCTVLDLIVTVVSADIWYTKAGDTRHRNWYQKLVTVVWYQKLARVPVNLVPDFSVTRFWYGIEHSILGLKTFLGFGVFHHRNCRARDTNCATWLAGLLLLFLLSLVIGCFS